VLLPLLFTALLAQLPEPPTRPASGSGDYEIGPGDILKVAVYGHEDLSQVVVVQPDGTLSFPLIGRVKAAGRSPKSLEEDLGSALAKGFIRNPQVSVVVQEYRSKVVFVVGEVARPGSYPLSGNLSVVEVLARAGPMTQAAGSEVIVVRPSAATEGPVLPQAAAGAEVIKVNLREIEAGDLSRNVRLRPNDTVFVPQAPKVFVSGEVKSPGAFPFVSGHTVRQLISLAGGLTEDGSASRIRIVREIQGKAKEIKVKLDDPVQARDTIVVKARLF
jgi:polysaccharide export outer membrane protein